MKGKVVYTQMVEKEIEIPDEIIAIHDKSFWDWTDEEDSKMRNFCESTWKSLIEEKDFCDKYGIYYEENGAEWALDEY